MTAAKQPVQAGFNSPGPPTRTDEQLRRDRIIGIVVIGFILAAMAWMVWLASMGGAPVEPYDYWPMMP